MVASACAALLALAPPGARPAQGAPAVSTTESNGGVVSLVRRAARPLAGNRADHAPLLRLVDDARFVLLGEETHGTHEFYRERARITRRLIEEKGFTAVAVEGDWPDVRRLDHYVTGSGGDPGAEVALSEFTRFPCWM